MTHCTQVGPDQINVFITSTYTDGEAPDSARWFFKYIAESATDFRVSKSTLKGFKYTVVALGNSLYGDQYCKVCFCFNDYNYFFGLGNNSLP